MRRLASRLIAAERIAGDPSDTDARAAFRVCEKLRRPLSTLAGVAGFRSLLSRAWVLAKSDASLLAGVKIKMDGTFQLSPEVEAQIATPEAAEAAHALVTELLGLLVTFIGEALTLRLVHEVWAGRGDEKSEFRKNSL